MSILKSLGLTASSDSPATGGAGNTETVRRIVGELEDLEEERARYIASFAYILGRVANADREISAEETRKMEEIVERLGHLSPEQAILVVQIAKSQNRLFGGTENYLVTREFKAISTPQQRQELIDCLFAVSAADASITTAEEAQVRLIASELGMSHREFVLARREYSRHREVMKSFHGGDDAADEGGT